MASILILRSTILVLFLLVATTVTAVPGTFNVLDYQAKADGKTDNSKAFLAAWTEACAYAGAANYIIPAGKFLVGPVSFDGPCKGKITFKVDGTVLAPTNLGVFPAGNWVVFQWLKGLTVTGKGIFDGQGASAWPNNHRSGQVFPTSVQFSSCDDSLVEGITSLNAKMFHIMVYKCTNFKIRGVTITAPESSPNTDGIHIGLSTNVEITESKIGTGDDCISVGPTNHGITITKVFCGPGHGISVGSLGKYSDDKDVTNLYVKNCTLTKTMNGVRVKSWQKSFSLTCKNFTFEDIHMVDASNPIIIDQEYCPAGNCGSQSPSKVKIIDMKFRNIRGTSLTPVAVNLKCSELVPCSNVELTDIDLVYHGGETSASCENVVSPKTMGAALPSTTCE